MALRSIANRGVYRWTPHPHSLTCRSSGAGGGGESPGFESVLALLASWAVRISILRWYLEGRRHAGEGREGSWDGVGALDQVSL